MSFWKNGRGPMLVAVAASLWAFDGVLRRSLYTLAPLIIVFYEHLIGTLLVLPTVWKNLQPRMFTKKVVLLTMAVSALSGVLGTLWFTTALQQVQFIPFSVVLLLQKLQPLFAISLAAVVLKEKITTRYLGWAALAAVAAYFVTFPGGVISWNTPNTIIAALYAVGAAAAWGSSTVISKLLLEEVKSSSVATLLRFSFTTVLAGLSGIGVGLMPQLSTITSTQLSRLGVIALSTGMVALWLYYRGLKTTQAKVATIVELIFPVLAVAIDGFVYQSWLIPSQYLAAIVLFGAIYKVSQLQSETLVVEKSPTEKL